MTAAQFRAVLDYLELSQFGVGRLLGVGERTPRRWASGDSPIPEAAVIILRLLVTSKVTIEDIDEVRDDL